SRGRRTGLKTRRSDTFSVFERARWLASTYRILLRAQTCDGVLKGSWTGPPRHLSGFIDLHVELPPGRRPRLGSNSTSVLGGGDRATDPLRRCRSEPVGLGSVGTHHGRSAAQILGAGRTILSLGNLENLGFKQSGSPYLPPGTNERPARGRRSRSSL